MNHLPAKCVVDWNFGHSEPLCTDIHPCRISYPKESPQATYEPIDERKKKNCKGSFSKTCCYIQIHPVWKE